MANAIDPSLYLSNYQAQQKQTGSSALGKDDFLKILIAQLQNQDPTSPMEDKEFIAQMAQFTSLEQMSNMNNTLQALVDSQKQSQMMEFSGFIGKEVTWHNIIDSEEEEEEPTIEEGTGRVVSVQFKNGSVTLTLADGTVLEPANISEVKESTVEIE